MTANRNLFAILASSLFLIFIACEDYTDGLSDEEDADFDSYEDGDLHGRATGTVAYQAEDHSFQSGCAKSSVHSGYTGTGFMDYGGNGSLVEWNSINVPAAGQYKLIFRYANGGGGARQCAVTVNDTTIVGNVAFGPSGAWTTWATASLTANLKAGNNKIRITANTGSGGPNLDKMDVEPIGGTNNTGTCALVSEGQSATLSCPSGQVITSIQFASYGTPTGSCPSFATSSCHASSSKTKVESSCLNKTSCTIGANNAVFGDPCSGTRKKLAVAYTCSTTTPTVGTCAQAPEGSSATLSCPSGKIIDRIDFASYGVPTGTCPSFSTGTCHATTSKTKVESLCLNKPSCTVGANNGVFGDPCGGVGKKLAIVFTCGNGGSGDGNQALKVFILAGQSNMVGQGTVNPTQAHLDKNGGKGTLKYLTTNAGTRSTYAHLVGSNGGWASRNDVWLVDLDNSGPLTITKETFGPELQFGHVIGNYYDAPVLIIKTSWGGKSLKVDFRPPSSGGTLGPYYTTMVDRVHQVLSNIKQFYPGYNGQGYELVGFGWHQGWNDRIDSAAVAEYQTNCVNLINDLRREFNASKLRFVLATTGMGGWNETNTRAVGLMNAQLAVPKDSRLQSGYVSAVETRDYWRDQSISPADQNYHWNRNAETYFLLGDGMGKAMITSIKTP